VTSNPYADPAAVKIIDKDFETGSLHRVSYARPGKLFTANIMLMDTEAGKLNDHSFNNIVKAVIEIFQRSIKP